MARLVKKCGNAASSPFNVNSVCIAGHRVICVKPMFQQEL
jgi:hypothetical protein